MSKAFTREDDADQQSDLPERAIPPYPNLVTAEGLDQIEDALTRHTEQHNEVRAAGDTAHRVLTWIAGTVRLAHNPKAAGWIDPSLPHCGN